jgi:hypothetical protein
MLFSQYAILRIYAKVDFGYSLIPGDFKPARLVFHRAFSELTDIEMEGVTTYDEEVVSRHALFFSSRDDLVHGVPVGRNSRTPDASRA